MSTFAKELSPKTRRFAPVFGQVTLNVSIKEGTQMKSSIVLISLLITIFTISNANAIDIKDKALYITKAQKIVEMGMLGLKASLRDSGDCVGSRKRKCTNFVNSFSHEKLNKIAASIFINYFSSEDINNLYLYFTEGPGEKEINNALIQVKLMLNPNESTNAIQLLSDSEVSYRNKFNKTNTGIKFSQFVKVASIKYQQAIKPYMSVLAKNAGLIK